MKRKNKQPETTSKKKKTKTPHEEFEEHIANKEKETERVFLPLETIDKEEDEITLEDFMFLGGIYLEDSILQESNDLQDEIFKKYGEEFSRVFSFTLVFKTLEYWYADTDMPEEVQKIIIELGKR
eukprot:gene6938-11101_t